MTEQRRIIIIGGGIAGLSAAQAARQQDPQAHIFLVCGESVLPYYRTRIPELINGADPEKLNLRSYQWYIDNNIQVVRSKATAVVSDNRQVRFSDGSYLYYDSLVIASGASGLIPETAYAQLPGVGPLRDREDVARIQAHRGSAVVLGDGLLALEIAWQLSRSGRDVTIVGRERRLLHKQLDQEASGFLLRVIELLGLHIALRGELAALEDGRAYLADGRAFEAATVVFATGIRSNVKMGQSAGVAINRGILVDEQMQTSLPQIWAAGDCAEFQGEIPGMWTVAMAQGTVAGINAAGGKKLYQPETPLYTMQAMGVELFSYGDISSQDCFSLVDSYRPSFGKLFFQQDTLAGLEAIGTELPFLQLRKAVEQRLPRREALALLKETLA